MLEDIFARGRLGKNEKPGESHLAGLFIYADCGSGFSRLQ